MQQRRTVFRQTLRMTMKMTVWSSPHRQVSSTGGIQNCHFWPLMLTQGLTVDLCRSNHREVTQRGRLSDGSHPLRHRGSPRGQRCSYTGHCLKTGLVHSFNWTCPTPSNASWFWASLCPRRNQAALKQDDAARPRWRVATAQHPVEFYIKQSGVVLPVKCSCV